MNVNKEVIRNDIIEGMINKSSLVRTNLRILKNYSDSSTNIIEGNTDIYKENLNLKTIKLNNSLIMVEDIFQKIDNNTSKIKEVLVDLENYSNNYNTYIKSTLNPNSPKKTKSDKMVNFFNSQSIDSSNVIVEESADLIDIEINNETDMNKSQFQNFIKTDIIYSENEFSNKKISLENSKIDYESFANKTTNTEAAENEQGQENYDISFDINKITF